MEVNVNRFAPPNAEVADIPEVGPAEPGTPVFFPVSLAKLLILSFCTLGLYEFYWYYKNWQLVRARTKENISPFWRAFFAVFFCYSLFRRVRAHSRYVSAWRFSAGLLAAAWIGFTILWKLPDPYWLLTFVAIFALLPVQHAINDFNQVIAPRHKPNSRFSAWNWVAVGLGGPLFLLAVYGTFLPNP